MTTMATNEYEQQAQAFLTKYGLTLKATVSDTKRPTFTKAGEDHGRHYHVTIARADHHAIRFDFWGSIADRDTGKPTGAYDILSCLSADVRAPTDPDEVADEFGDMKPSQAVRIANFAKRLQAFFTAPEIDDLSEIN